MWCAIVERLADVHDPIAVERAHDIVWHLAPTWRPHEQQHGVARVARRHVLERIADDRVRVDLEDVARWRRSELVEAEWKERLARQARLRLDGTEGHGALASRVVVELLLLVGMSATSGAYKSGATRYLLR